MPARRRPSVTAPILFHFIAMIWMVAGASPAAEAAVEAVTFQSNGYTLHGCISRPDGDGPFPAIIYNHGSEKNPAPCGPPDLTRAYVGKGFLFFAFQRHGHDWSAGEYIVDLQHRIFHETSDPIAQERRIVALHESYNPDVAGAVAWLLARPEVDRTRVAMTGVSFGAIQTLLSAGKRLDLRGFIAFAPAAQSWRNGALQQRLIQATLNANAPLFLAQAENDFSLGPSCLLGPIIRGKGAPNEAKVYPPFGTTPQQGHAGFAATDGGIAIWQADVFGFLNAVMK
jgi:carboxymethylenebutenolidase